MTAKEKAVELLYEFKIYNYDWIAKGSDVTAKQCAIIAIDEMLKIRCKKLSYWQQVKTEIENL